MRPYPLRYNLFLLLLSVGVFSFGQGLIGTLISLKITDTQAGNITSIYYLGMLLGSVYAASLINKLGMIKTYAIILISLALFSVLLGFWNNVTVWYVLRLLSGYALAHAYIIIESSLLAISNQANRVRLLSFYGISLYGLQSVSQLSLHVFNPDGLAPFIWSGALTVLAILPLYLAHYKPPTYPKSLQLSNFFKLYKVHPASVICAFVSGLLIASIYGLLPRYLENIGLNVASIANLMTVTLAGTVMLKYPLGYCADAFGRINTLLGSCIGSLMLCGGIMWLANQHIHHVVVIGCILFLLGGFVFSKYAICMAYLYERTKRARYNLDIPQGALVAYCLGSVSGPVVISYFMQSSPSFGLFGCFALTLTVLTGVLIHGMRYYKTQAR